MRPHEAGAKETDFQARVADGYDRVMHFCHEYKKLNPGSYNSVETDQAGRVSRVFLSNSVCITAASRCLPKQK